jgi:hypothetical protein
MTIVRRPSGSPPWRSPSRSRSRPVARRHRRGTGTERPQLLCAPDDLRVSQSGSHTQGLSLLWKLIAARRRAHPHPQKRRQQAEIALAQLDLQQRERIGIGPDEACTVLDALPDLSKPLAKANPELRRSVYEAFRFGIELDRNKPEIRLKALVSSAFSTTSDLDDLAGMVTIGVIAGAGLIAKPATVMRAWALWDLAGKRWLREAFW